MNARHIAWWRWVPLALVFAAVSVQAQRPHHRPPHHNNWHNDWENRQDARRAAIVAGVVVAGVAGASARQQADERYEDCLLVTGYDYECDRRRYYDERRARDAARRAGVVAGLATYGVVRD